MNEEFGWEDLVKDTPKGMGVPFAKVRVVAKPAQCKPCRLIVEIDVDGFVHVSGSKDLFLLDTVRRMVEKAMRLDMAGQEMYYSCPITDWPWPLRPGDVVVRSKMF